MPLTFLKNRPRRSICVASASLAAILTGAALIAPADADQSSTRTSNASDDGASTADTQAAAGTGTRPFKATSYWNTPLGHAPRNPNNHAYVRDSQQHSGTHLKLVIGDWGMPMYRSRARDPLYHIGGIRVRIPRHAHSMGTSDAALSVTDPTTGQVVGLYGAHKTSSGWSGTVTRYRIGTNGIAAGLPTGSKSNFGHRGIPSSIQAVRRSEIRRGVIRHRLELYWHETKSGRAVFPMTGSESGKSGVVPEGTVVRIKPGVNLKAMHLSRGAYIIARALQRYGGVIGDNSGQGNSLKLQGNANWGGVLNKDSLRKIKWSDYMFVKGGYRP
jgi:hypothetical protein